MATFNMYYYDFFFVFNELKLYLPKEKSFKKSYHQNEQMCIPQQPSNHRKTHQGRAHVEKKRQMPQASEKGRVCLHFTVHPLGINIL